VAEEGGFVRRILTVEEDNAHQRVLDKITNDQDRLRRIQNNQRRAVRALRAHLIEASALQVTTLRQGAQAELTKAIAEADRWIIQRETEIANADISEPIINALMEALGVML
jgi:hypothetical protein